MTFSMIVTMESLHHPYYSYDPNYFLNYESFPLIELLQVHITYRKIQFRTVFLLWSFSYC